MRIACGSIVPAALTAAVLTALLGCGAAARAPAAAPRAATRPVIARELAVAEPYRPAAAAATARRQRPEADDPLGGGAIRFGLRDPLLAPYDADGAREDIIERGPRRLLERGQVGEEDLEGEAQRWDPCVRDFVHTRPEPARRAFTRALARYETACGESGAVIVRAALGVDGRGRAGRSDVGLTAARSELALRVAYCGASPAAERIVIAADHVRWTSQRLAFVRDARGCDAAELPLTRTLARVVRDLAEAADGAIAFEGGSAQDLVVTEEMKQDLRVLLDALDAAR